MIRGCMDCTDKSLSFKEDVWTNVRTHLSRGDIVDQGDFVNKEDSYGPLRLLLRSNDGKFILYRITLDKVWSAKTTGGWIKDPPTTTYPDGPAIGYYLNVTNNGHLRAYSITCDDGAATVDMFYDRNLRTLSLPCFTVEYFPAPIDDLVAVPCAPISKTKCFNRVKEYCTYADYNSGMNCYQDYVDAYCAAPHGAGGVYKNYGVKSKYDTKC